MSDASDHLAAGVLGTMSTKLVTILTTLGLYAAVVVSPGSNFALLSRFAVSGAAAFGLRLVTERLS